MTSAPEALRRYLRMLGTNEGISASEENALIERVADSTHLLAFLDALSGNTIEEPTASDASSVLAHIARIKNTSLLPLKFTSDFFKSLLLDECDRVRGLMVHASLPEGISGDQNLSLNFCSSSEPQPLDYVFVEAPTELDCLSLIVGTLPLDDHRPAVQVELNPVPNTGLTENRVDSTASGAKNHANVDCHFGAIWSGSHIELKSRSCTPRQYDIVHTDLRYTDTQGNELRVSRDLVLTCDLPDQLIFSTQFELPAGMEAVDVQLGMRPLRQQDLPFIEGELTAYLLQDAEYAEVQLTSRATQLVGELQDAADIEELCEEERDWYLRVVNREG